MCVCVRIQVPVMECLSLLEMDTAAKVQIRYKADDIS